MSKSKIKCENDECETNENVSTNVNILGAQLNLGKKKAKEKKNNYNKDFNRNFNSNERIIYDFQIAPIYDLMPNKKISQRFACKYFGFNCKEPFNAVVDLEVKILKKNQDYQKKNFVVCSPGFSDATRLYETDKSLIRTNIRHPEFSNSVFICQKKDNVNHVDFEGTVISASNPPRVYNEDEYKKIKEEGGYKCLKHNGIDYDLESKHDLFFISWPDPPKYVCWKVEKNNIQASYVLDVGISNINPCLNEYDNSSYRSYNEVKYSCGCRELSGKYRHDQKHYTICNSI